jgi:hypothetical protein
MAIHSCDMQKRIVVLPYRSYNRLSSICILYFASRVPDFRMAGLSDPFEDFKRRRDRKGAEGTLELKKPVSDKLERISDFFPAYKEGAEPVSLSKPAPAEEAVLEEVAPHAPASGPGLERLVHKLVSKGVLTEEEAKEVLG